MGQIIGRTAKPDACNLRSLSSFGTPAAGQHILVSTDNSAMQNGQGNFDAYVVGDGNTAATALELKEIVPGLSDIKDWMPPFEKRQVQLIRGTGGYGATNGSTNPYKIGGASWLSKGIPVSQGEVVTATLAGLNSAVAPIVFRDVSTITPNAPAGTYTPLCTYNSSNSYKVTIENDGYIFVTFLYDENNPVYITIQSKRATFNEVVDSLEAEDANLQDNIDELDAKIEDAIPTGVEQVNAAYGTAGYVGADGGSSSYRIGGVSVISSPISVQAGDKISVTITSGLNNAAAPISYKATRDYSSSAAAGTFTPLCVYAAGTTEYSGVAPADGYVFLTFDPNIETIVSISRKKDIDEVVQSLRDSDNTIQENVDELGSELDEISPLKTKQVRASHGRAGYVGADGGSSSYRIGGVSAISQPIAVQKGDRVSVTITNGINNAAAPIAYKATSDYSSSAPAGTFTPLCVYSAGVTDYSGVAPDDGYIFITFDPSIETIVNISKRTLLPWYGKKWACVGDSLTEVNNTATKRYYDYVSENTGITTINMGAGGTGYKRAEGSDLAFYQRILNIDTSVDVVTIFGSFNDLNYSVMGDYSSFDEMLGNYDDVFDENSDSNTLAACINKTISNLQSVIPLVRVGIVAPCPWVNTRPETNPNGGASKYVDMLKKIAAYHSIPFLDLWRESNLRPWDVDFRNLAYSHDSTGQDGNPAGTHPDENGHAILAPKFKDFLEMLIL